MPVAVSSILNKIFEMILLHQLSTFLENKILLNPNQYDFHTGTGRVEAVVTIRDSLYIGFSEVGALFYDVSKAFSPINHLILAEKLKFYSVRGTEMYLIESY